MEMALPMERGRWGKRDDKFIKYALLEFNGAAEHDKWGLIWYRSGNNTSFSEPQHCAQSCFILVMS